MKAIQTHYLPATNTMGSRIVATAEGKGNRVIVPYDHSGKEHQVAALALCKRLGWHGRLIEGGLPSGDHVFVWSQHGGDAVTFSE